MARLLTKALARAGFSPTLASELRTLDPAGDPARQDRLRRESEIAADRLADRFRSLAPPDRPVLWFTYHLYYKAPDWIGPRVADALGIPYVVAEGSRAPKRARGPWALGHAAAEAALDRADAILVMTDRDRIALEAARPAGQVIADLPPFIDAAAWGGGPPPGQSGDGAPRLLAVAMMRPGDKLASYRILASALLQIRHLPWTLDVVGDGEARPEVEALFAPLADRTRFHGQVEAGPGLRALYEGADLFLWPAVNEAYGMVLLEAQLFGCPVIAGAYGGVASVVQRDETGILTPPGDADAFARAAGALVVDADLRRRMGASAMRFVREQRDLEPAADILRRTLLPLVAGGAP
ncbi:glycosyltransferase [Microvirga thermotolerans]|uniref:Glycosyltransferase n=2 Tax=Microvirga thermotolerans TaxID=2651334 RepID=A0A5P9K0G7_9HYPH|nr:glycosyltransferase [Microvirga thermotolerans]